MRSANGIDNLRRRWPSNLRPGRRTPRQLNCPVAVILDLDGTLVDTVSARIDAWIDAATGAGIRVSRASIARRIGMDGKRLAGELAQAAGAAIDESQAHVIDRAAGEIFARLNARPRPLPGGRELIGALQAAHIPWAIATSSRPDQVSASIAALGIDGAATIIDSSRVATAKPAPELLLAAAHELGVDPTGCWYVGDSTWDIGAARAAGMRAIAVSVGSAVGDRTLQAAGPDVIVDTLSDVARLLEDCRSRAPRDWPGHLVGAALPPIALPATDGSSIRLDDREAPPTVVFAYPRTGRPGEEPPGGREAWAAIPGAVGCTAEACGYRDRIADFRRLGVRVFGLSTQDTLYQREAAERLALPYPLLSDKGLLLARALSLPRWTHYGKTLLRRLTFVIIEGVISWVEYPVWPPEEDADRALLWLRANVSARRAR
jgi:HAD superfamily hydrolase (TIGR01509 family)